MVSGQIRSKSYLKKSTGGKKSPKKGKGKPKPVTGPVRVQKYANFLKTDANGGLVIDTEKVKAAQAKVQSRPKKPSGKVGVNKSAVKAAAKVGSQWEDPALVEERNRMANMANNPPPPPQYQAPQGQQGMFNQYQQMFAPQQPQVSNQVPQMANQQPPQVLPPIQDYGMYGGGSPMYGAYDAYGGPGGVAVQPVEPDANWRRAPTGGVLQPHELPGSQVSAPKETQSNSGDIMSLIENLSTQEMIALACGGAGFLLFIVVIIVIVIRFKRKQQSKKNKTKDAERKEWQANNDPLPPPPGYQPSMSSKDPAHLARIQGRELPPPPLSFTQSAGATGMTSGTFISSDERPSMRHKD